VRGKREEAYFRKCGHDVVKEEVRGGVQESKKIEGNATTSRILSGLKG
jgi:hypothetical protein